MFSFLCTVYDVCGTILGGNLTPIGEQSGPRQFFKHCSHDCIMMGLLSLTLQGPHKLTDWQTTIYRMGGLAVCQTTGSTMEPPGSRAPLNRISECSSNNPYPLPLAWEHRKKFRQYKEGYFSAPFHQHALLSLISVRQSEIFEFEYVQ